MLEKDVGGTIVADIPQCASAVLLPAQPGATDQS
jgi:hypothetical protein